MNKSRAYIIENNSELPINFENIKKGDKFRLYGTPTDENEEVILQPNQVCLIAIADPYLNEQNHYTIDAEPVVE
jgi:hypothetical protein